MKNLLFAQKRGFCYLLFLLLPLLSQANNLSPEPNSDDSLSVWFEPWMDRAFIELGEIEQAYFDDTEPLRMRLFDVNLTLSDPRNRTPECGFQLLWEKIQLENTLDELKEEHELKVLDHV